MKYPFSETRQNLRNRIFDIRSEGDFNHICMQVFAYQAENNHVFASWLKALSINPENILTPEQIPFLPISFFKNHPLYCGSQQPSLQFTSSGTTGSVTSTHFVADPGLYEQSFFNGFERVYGNPEDQVIIGLLPAYLERPGSSLIYMTQGLIDKSRRPESGFYLNNYSDLCDMLQKLSQEKKRVWLIGVSFALLDFSELLPPAWDELTVVETGGMKGRRKEMIREELHATIQKNWPLAHIYSEYGMTELLSQAWMGADGFFRCPPWMNIHIYDTGDPFHRLGSHQTGKINVIDLANLDSCSFIATQDLGRKQDDGNFEVLGRFDNSDLRGCNLMVE